MPSVIMKVLVGSYAHGLQTEKSDKDYKTVYVVKTSDLLKVNAASYKGKHNIADDDDNDNYEIGHFLSLATKSNPTILEVFKAPVVYSDKYADTLMSLFPSVWSSDGIYNSYLGFSHNQYQQMLDEKKELERRSKVAVACIRVLLQGIEILNAGSFSVRVKDFYPYFQASNLRYHDGGTILVDVTRAEEMGNPVGSWRTFLADIRSGIEYGCFSDYIGEIVKHIECLREELQIAYANNPNKEVDYDSVNNFLLSVRQNEWK